MAFDSFSAAGVAAISMGVIDINGIPWGTKGSGTVSTTTALARMPFAKRFGGVIPNPVRATPVGDNNRNRHEYLFNPANSGEMAITQHAFDMNQAAGMLGIKKVTDGNGDAILIGSNAPVGQSQSVVCVNVDAQEAGVIAQFGFKKFINEIYPLCFLTPLMANLQEVAPAEWQFYGIPTQAGQLPWGTPFTLMTHGATRASGYLIGSDYPIVIESYLAVGAETTFTLTYTPAVPASTYAVAWKFASGVWSSESIVSITGKVVTVAALTAGDIIEIRYESTDFLQAA